jgi:hypothetical protein
MMLKDRIKKGFEELKDTFKGEGAKAKASTEDLGKQGSEKAAGAAEEGVQELERAVGQGADRAQEGARKLEAKAEDADEGVNARLSPPGADEPTRR